MQRYVLKYGDGFPHFGKLFRLLADAGLRDTLLEFAVRGTLSSDSVLVNAAGSEEYIESHTLSFFSLTRAEYRELDVTGDIAQHSVELWMSSRNAAIRYAFLDSVPEGFRETYGPGRPPLTRMELP